MIYYTADLHLGHKNVIKYNNRPFSSVEEMDKYLIEAWNSRISDNDDVYMVGDLSYRNKNNIEYYLKSLKGRKHLVIGNHDLDIINNSDLRKYFVEIENIITVKDNENMIVLCHYPIAEWNGYSRGWYHIYGHIHNNRYRVFDYMKHEERALNAGCMINGYMPVTFKELVINNNNYKKQYL